MSATKAMRKWLETASIQDIRRHLTLLKDGLDVERNPMLRSSIAARIAMAEQVLADEARWAIGAASASA